MYSGLVMIPDKCLDKALMSVINTGINYILELSELVQKLKRSESFFFFFWHRSIIFTNSTEELRLATISKEREQLKSRSSIVTTQIQQLGTFYRAEPDHQVHLYFLFALTTPSAVNPLSFCDFDYVEVWAETASIPSSAHWKHGRRRAREISSSHKAKRLCSRTLPTKSPETYWL